MTTAIAAPRPQLIRSEVTKLLSLRAVWVTALVTFSIVVLVGWSQAGAIGDALRTNDPALAPGATPATVGFDWVALGLIGIVVIGVIAASSEYVSGQFKTSLVAAPHRARLFLAKSAALVIVVGALGIVTIPLLSLLSQSGLKDLSVIEDGIPATLVFKWVGAIAYWVAMALMSFALGIIMRQTLIPLFLVIVISQMSLMLLLLSNSLAYLPSIAGIQLFDPGLVTGSYPGAALPLLVAVMVTIVWTLALLAIAGWRFLKRDA